MGKHIGKYLAKPDRQKRTAPFAAVPLSFFLVELFAVFFLSLDTEDFDAAQLWPLPFGALWAAFFSGVVRLLPMRAGRVLFGAV